MANSVDPDPIGAVCSGFMLFASILNSSVMVGSRRHFQMLFLLGALRVNYNIDKTYQVLPNSPLYCFQLPQTSVVHFLDKWHHLTIKHIHSLHVRKYILRFLSSADFFRPNLHFVRNFRPDLGQNC